MKTIFAIFALSMLIPCVVHAQPLQLIDEFKKLGHIEKSAPQLTYALVNVNTRTAMKCELVLPIPELFHSEQFSMYYSFMLKGGAAVEPEKATELLSKTVDAVCSGNLTPFTDDRA